MKTFAQLLCLSFVMLGLQAEPSITKEQAMITIYTDFHDEEHVMEEVNTILNNHHGAYVQVIDERLIQPSNKQTSKMHKQSGYHIGAVMCDVSFYQSQSTILSMVIGAPGVHMSISDQIDLPNVYESTFAIENALVSSAIGFDVTAKQSIRLKGSYRVPMDGTKTKLIASPVTEVYHYSIYEDKNKKGTGTAQRMIGVAFHIEPLDEN